MWREPEMRKMHAQLAVVAGIVIFVAAALVVSMVVRRSPKSDDKQSTLKL